MRLSYCSAGESHGKGIVAVLEGLPKGLRIDLAFIDRQLHRRQHGYGRGGRQRIEHDRVEILSGLYRGMTMGSPLTLWVRNVDHKLEELPQPTRPRPGHVDLAGCQRHGDRDIRSVLERASARETAARVAAGAVAQLLLQQIGIAVLGRVIAIGPVDLDQERGGGIENVDHVDALRDRIEASPFGTSSDRRDDELRAAIDAAARDGDTLGGVLEVVAVGFAAGLGLARAVERAPGCRPGSSADVDPGRQGRGDRAGLRELAAPG
jgi:chorismate synthase